MLEIGCGTGLLTEVLVETGASVVAVDISEDLLQRARARGLPPERVTFRGGRFEEMEFGRTFDAVVGSSVLHHLDLALALPRIAMYLRPGGWLCFAEPNLLNPQVFLERTLRFLPMFSYVSPDETAFVRWRLRTVLGHAGFTEVRVTPFDWLHPSTPREFIPAVARLGSLLEGVPLIREFAGSLQIRARKPIRPERGDRGSVPR